MFKSKLNLDYNHLEQSDFDLGFLVLDRERSDERCLFVQMAFINQKRAYPGFSNSALWLLGTDMAMGVVIPDINATVVYRGSSFSIELPHTLFGGNTEGLCGE